MRRSKARNDIGCASIYLHYESHLGRMRGLICVDIQLSDENDLRNIPTFRLLVTAIRF
jgi:hypothetical protein